MNHLRHLLIAVILLLCFPAYTFAQLTQTVRGQVVDRETKVPLIGATVMLANSDTGSTTNTTGNFSLNSVPTGRISLIISYLGYETQRLSELQLTSGKELVLTIEMKESLQSLNEVVITAHQRKDLPQNDMASVSARTFSVEEARRYAGAVDDPARMAANFAGVTTGSAETNVIIVRGNAPSGVLWRMEGVDIPVPSHFSGGDDVPGGGVFTIFSSSMLANSDFYTGAFPAEFGNAVAGVFDMKFRNGNNQKHEFTAQLGIQGAEFAAEGPFKKGYGGSYLFNVRVSTMGIIKSFISEMSGKQSIHYEDIAFKVNLPTRQAGTFTLWGIGGNSQSEREAEEDPSTWVSTAESTDMKIGYKVGAVGISHKQSFNSSLYLSTTLAGTLSDTDLEFGRRRVAQPTVSNIDINNLNRSYRLSLSSRLNHRHSSQWHSRYGIRLEQFFDKFNYQKMDTERIMQTVSSKHCNTQLLQANAQTKYAFNPLFSFTGGLNATLFTLNGDFSIEPRLSVEWTFNRSHSIMLGTGLHSQIAPLYFYFMEVPTGNGETSTPNTKLKMTRSWHNVFSYNWTISPLLRLKVEPYFQYLYNVPVLQGDTYSTINTTTQPPLFYQPFTNRGKGMNVGIDFTLERFLQSGYYYMATLSLFDSRYKDDLGDWHSTLFNTHYIINLLGGKEFTFRRKNGLNSVLGLNARIALSGYRPSSPVDLAATQEQQDIIYDESKPFTHTRKGISPVSDLSITYRVNYKKCSGTVAVQIKNLAGKQYMGQEFNLATQQVEDLYFNSMIPFISYKMEF